MSHQPAAPTPTKARRPGLVLLVATLIAALVPFVTADPAEALIRSPFTTSYGTDDTGGIALIGASSMDCPAATSGCVAARSGSGTGAALNNNGYTMNFVDVDSDPSTSNSSTATLAMPSGSTVLYAKLVWGGRTVPGSGTAPTKALETVKFKPPGAPAYTTVTGALTQPAALVASGDNGPYQASLDVTAQVAAGGNGVYSVADIGAAFNALDRYAGWSLVVAYRNPALPMRNLRVFEGFADVNSAALNNTLDIPLTGFLTPPSGTVNASVGFVAWEGDLGTTGDAMRLAGTTLSDATRPANNFFDSRITEAGADQTGRAPGYLNNFGVDIGSVATTNIIPNGATSTTINLTTGGDAYYPGIVTSQIDLYTPQFNSISKTATNLNGNNPAQPGDVIEYRLNFTNSGADYADSAVVRDVVPSGLTYVPGSTTIVTDPSGRTGPVTDATGDDVGDYTSSDRTVRVRVGTGANATSGGSVAPGTSSVVRFRATVNRTAAGTTIINTPLLDYTARVLSRSFTFAGTPAITPVQALADLGITKTVATPTQNSGGTANYTLNVGNAGPNDASTVVVTDTLPSGATFNSATTPAGTTCSAAGQVVTCTTPTLANGASLTIGLVANLDPAIQAAVAVNSARVSAATADDSQVNNTATASSTITSLADLRVGLSLAPPSALPGGRAIATITATNAGPSTANGTTLSTQLPDGTRFVSSRTCTANGNLVTCPRGTLAPGAQVSSDVVLALASSYTGNSLTMTATGSSTTAEANPADNSATASVPVAPLANLSLTVSADDPNPVAGTTTGYTVSVLNSGPSDAQNVTVTIPAVPGATFVSASPQSGSCTINAGSITCDFGALPAGGEDVVTLRLAIDGSEPAGPLSVTANAATTTNEETTDDDTDTATTTVQRVADLGVVLAAAPQPIVAGQPVTYTATITNRGPSAAGGATLTDSLPAGLTPTAATASSGSCAIAGQDVSCDLGELPAGGTATVQITASTPGAVPAGGFANSVTVASSSTDPNAADNTAGYNASVTAQADVQVTGDAQPASAITGQNLTYRFTARNNGPSTADGIVLTPSLPAGFAVTSATSTQGTCAADAGGVLRCAIGTLAGGASADVTLQVAIPANQDPGTGTASATATATTPDPTTSNNTASITTTVTTQADVRLTGGDFTTPLIAGQSFSRSISITNAGPSDARDTVLVADLPTGVADLAATVNGLPCTVQGTRITCPVGTLAPGASATATATGRIVPSSPPGDRQVTVTASSSTNDPTPANNTTTRTTQVTAQADLSLTQQVDTSPLVAGSRATYTTTITNAGPSDARGVQLGSQFPAPLTVISASTSLGSCSTADGGVDCSIDQLAAGSTATVTVVVQVAPDATGVASTNATLTSATPDPTPAGSSTSLSTPVTQVADLVVTGNQSADPVRAGTAQTYSVTVTNTGPSRSAGATLTETLPDGLTLLPGGVQAQRGTCATSADGRTVDCALGALEPGEAVTVVLTAQVPPTTPAGTALVLVAQAGSAEADPSPDNRRLELSSTTSSQADLTTTVSASSSNAEAGVQQTYLVQVSNAGPSTALGASVSDQLPNGATVTGVTTTAGSCASGATSVDCALGDLAPGASATVQITVLLAQDLSGSLTNTVTGASSVPDGDTADNTASTTQNVTASSDLSATASVVSGAVVAGSPVTYRVGATNNGPALARQVLLSDPIPSGLVFSSATPTSGGTCQVVSGVVDCAWPQLAVGESVSADLTFTVDSTTPAGTNVANTVRASSSQPDPSPGNDTATAGSTSGAVADVSLSTVLISGAPVAGGRLTWQTTIRNTGPSSAPDVVLSNPAPSGVTLDGGQTTAGTCTVTGGSISCPVGAIPAGGSVVVTTTGVLAADFTGSAVTSTITAVANGASDPNPGDNTTSTTTDANTSADLAVTVTPGQANVVPGQTATWTVSATNSGPSTSRGVVVTQTFPAGVVPQASAGCTVSGDSVSCPLGDVAPGQTATATITALVTPGYTTPSVRTTATAFSSTADPAQGDNTTTSDSASSPTSDLGVTVTPPAGTTAGEQATWTVTATSSGPSDAQGVVVTADIPASLLDVTATWPGGACTISGGTATCPIGAVPAGQSVPVTITGLVSPSNTTPVDVAASVTAQTPDQDTANNSGGSSVASVSSADLQSQLTAPTALTPGQQATWTLQVRNLGPSDATGAEADLTLPDGVGGITATGPGGPCAITGQQVTCPVGALADGQTATVTVTGTLAADSTATTLDTAAGITSPTNDPDNSNSTATATSQVTPSGDLSVAASVTSGVPVAGAPIEIVVDVTSRGPSDARNVVLTDALPASITDATATTPQGTCVITGRDLRCELGDIPAGAGVVTVTVRGTLALDAGDSVSTTATVTSDTPDPDTGDNSSTVTSSATTSSNLSVTASAPGDAVAGRPLSYTVTITNAGPSVATGVKLEGVVPPQVLGASTDRPDCPSPTDCALPDLAPGESVTVTISGTVDPAYTGAPLTVRSTVTSASGDPDSRDNSVVTTIGVGSSADLSVTFDADPQPLVPGTNALYTATVTSAGPSAANGTLTFDPLPAGITLNGSPSTDRGSCSVVGGRVVCDLGSLPAGSTTTVRLPVSVAPSYSGDTASLGVTLQGSADDPNPADNTATSTAGVSGSADLSLSASAPAAVTPGVPATWTYTATNTGPSDAPATLKLTVPAGLGQIVATPSQGTCTLVSGEITCDLGSVTSGAPVTVSITGVLDESSTDPSVTVSAALDSPVAEPAGGSADDGRSTSTTTQVVPGADVSVSVIATDDSIVPGLPANFAVVATNSGPSTARDVVVELLLPAGSTDVVVDVPPGVTCTGARCTIAELAAGDSVALSYTATMPADLQEGALDIRATVTSATGDADQGDNTGSFTSPVGARSNLGLEFAVPQLSAGETTEATATITNDGPSYAGDVVFSMAVPQGAQVTPVDVPADFTCDTTADNVTCTAPRLRVGRFALRFAVAVPSTATADQLQLTGSVSSSAEDLDLSDNSASGGSTVTREANLSSQVTITPDVLVAGADVEISASFANDGPSDAAGVVFSLPVPVGMEVVTVIAPPGVECDTSLRCSVTSLPAGQSVELRATVRITPAFTADAADFTATTTSDTADPDTADNTTTVTRTVLRAADVSASVAVTPDVLVAGGPVQVRAVVRNTGPATAFAATLALPLPAAFTNVRVTGAGCDTTVACALGDLAAGAEVEVVIDAVLAADYAGALEFTATAGTSAEDPDTANNAATFLSAAGASADVQIRGSAPVTGTAGEQVTWSYTVTNEGPSQVADLLVVDTLPAGVTFVSASAGCAFDSGIVRCDLGVLPATQSVSLAITALIDPDFSGPLVNTTVVDSSASDPDPDSNTVTTTTYVGVGADLGVTQVLAPQPVIPGQEAFLTFTITNDGPSAAPLAQLTNSFEEGLTPVRFTTDRGDCAITGQVLTCDFGTLAPGDAVTVQAVVLVSPDFAPETVSNTVSISSAVEDPNQANNTASIVGSSAADADLSVVSTPSATEVVAGDELDWIIVVTNDGPSTARGIVLTDLIPDGVELLSTPAGCTLTGSRLDCALPNLSASDVASVVVETRVRASTTAQVSNTASVTSSTPEIDPADNLATSTVAIRTSAALSVTVAPEGQLVAGAESVWNVEVSNAGPSDALDVVLVQRLPEGAVFVSGEGCTAADGVVTCRLGTLAAGAKRSLRLLIRLAPAGDTASTTLTVSSATSDPVVEDNAVTASAALTRVTDVKITKVVDKTQATAGETVTWTIKVTNGGPSTATDVVVTEQLPSGYTFTATSASKGVFNASSGRWDVGTVAPGEEPTLIVSAVLPATGQVTNTATVVSGGEEPGEEPTTPTTPTTPTQPQPQPQPDDTASVTTDVQAAEPELPPLAWTGFDIQGVLLLGVLLTGVGILMVRKRAND
ncbi:conserved repeat domain protein [Actinosynnema mirum DSM 43827]|uniref:Conserved repeat domain protein n=1 Tax=Actinosynnema mirum (strain ATCC 29888 / DSM 43827 / JCM 3225 / NBRC 14064 / NCIMB 13271 / NRRL B-12336 / IMRU 3971 / 101) TaxID=446462 RepID=C6WL68_ACTMD|nr:conserved repeat domain protein [Actinosynnema mirum DSM 43827]